MDNLENHLKVEIFVNYCISKTDEEVREILAKIAEITYPVLRAAAEEKEP